MLYRKDNPEFLKLKAELENTPEYKKYDLAYNTDTGDTVQDLANMDKAQKEFFDSDVGKQYHSLMWDKSYPIQRKIKGFNDDTLNTIVHELQHQIQDIEGFATGGNLTSHSKLGRQFQDIKAKEINEQIINAYPELEKAFPKQGLALSKELQDYMVKSNYGHALNETNYPTLMNLNDKENDIITKILEKAKPDTYTEELSKISQYQNLSPSEYYKRLAGEAESRLAGARAKLTPEQRQIYNPANESSYLTNYGYDVIPEKQIVEFRNNKNNLYHKIMDDDNFEQHLLDDLSSEGYKIKQTNNGYNLYDKEGMEVYPQNMNYDELISKIKNLYAPEDFTNINYNDIMGLDSNVIPTYYLPNKEYGLIMHNVNTPTNIPLDMRKKKILDLPIADNTYTIENKKKYNKRILNKDIIYDGHNRTRRRNRK